MFVLRIPQMLVGIEMLGNFSEFSSQSVELLNQLCCAEGCVLVLKEACRSGDVGDKVTHFAPLLLLRLAEL